MALSATINKVSINIADMDRHYYQHHDLTMAMHPSENNLRFIVRLLAFALNAQEQLSFTRGLSTDDEPEIWLKSLTDEIELWIDFGQVDEKRIRKACGRAQQVIVYTYHERKAEIWWQQIAGRLTRHSNLSVFHIAAEGAEALVSRNMQLQCNIDDGGVSLSDDEQHFQIEVTRYTASA